MRAPENPTTLEEPQTLLEELFPVHGQLNVTATPKPSVSANTATDLH